ncbi:MAG: 2-oxoacid:acceptor oxidoreductase family protein [Candidatus Eisenbacteria bacterium]|nr:2-oxoacid:acceptor oxidoreductase family protein [Candidatus Eisenbacteria bacterium]
MSPMDIYLCGVGGQGIGLLADVLSHACLAAGYRVRGCDTHGLAQRHGTVVSHLRIGEKLFTPRVSPGNADLIIGLERLEAMRGALAMLKRGGTVVYYDTVYQPVLVRLGQASYPTAAEFEQAVLARGGRVVRVEMTDLPDPRMQNVALLGTLGALQAIPGVDGPVIEQALREGVPARVLEGNLAVYRRALSQSSSN